MLDPWIIEEILKKEEELRKEQEAPRAEMPIHRPPMYDKPSVTPTQDESERGVMIIDI
jgi:hypothetical protein